MSDLAAIGRFLHGERWQSPLSRDLQVATRTVQRWAAGDNDVPDGAMSDLITLAACRYVEQQVKQAAQNGLWSSGRIEWKAQPAEWSTETDVIIKTRAAEILGSVGIHTSLIGAI